MGLENSGHLMSQGLNWDHLEFWEGIYSMSTRASKPGQKELVKGIHLTVSSYTPIAELPHKSVTSSSFLPPARECLFYQVSQVPPSAVKAQWPCPSAATWVSLAFATPACSNPWHLTMLGTVLVHHRPGSIITKNTGAHSLCCAYLICASSAGVVRYIILSYCLKEN